MPEKPKSGNRESQMRTNEDIRQSPYHYGRVTYNRLVDKCAGQADW